MTGVIQTKCWRRKVFPEYKVVAMDVERVSAAVEKKAAVPEVVAVK